MPTAPPLIGSYSAPAVKRGDRVTCLYRDRDCTVTTLSDAPLPWPRVQPCDQRGGCGLWVNDELATAIRTESAAALRYWFGVSSGVVWKWRKSFGVGGHATTQGSKKAIRAAAKKGAAGVKAKVWTDAELDAKSALSKALRLRPPDRWKGRGGWTADEVKLLAIHSDAELAAEIGRSVAAVRGKRRAVALAGAQVILNASSQSAREVVVSEPRPTFYVAVVGALPEYDSSPAAARAAERLAAWLDKATVRAREHNRLGLVTFAHGVGAPWAKARGHSIILIPRFGGTVTAEKELIEFADAVVVVGNPASWKRLVRFAEEAGKPVRFCGG